MIHNGCSCKRTIRSIARSRARIAGREYPQLERTMAVNVFSGKVGKGHMGSNLAHESEAPFPEWLIEPLLVHILPAKRDGIQSVRWLGDRASGRDSAR